MRFICIAIFLLTPVALIAEPLSAPGDMRLRHDLQLLNDTKVINVPMTSWPVALGDIQVALNDADASALTPTTRAAYDRVREHLDWELNFDKIRFSIGLAGAEKPRRIRTFESMPRDEGEVSAGLSWVGERFAFKLAGTYVSDPWDGDEFRPDETYVGMVLGNWMMTAGWQDRWWGPGREGSLILSTNARPAPGLTLQRNISAPFKTKWLSWIGPWTFTTFMDQLDDDRWVNNALLFGMRGSFRPPNTGLEIALSRTAQWCGDGRPCDFQTFLRLLNGNDNRGANVDPEDEPGNQLGGIDVRWTLPKEIPVALYMQWISEDTRRTGASYHKWLKQLGAEYWGTIGGLSHRTHFEWSYSAAHLGGFGEGDVAPNIAYNHSVYRSGYRYGGRAIGYSGDGDTLSYSLGSTLVQSAGHSWNILLRYMEINRIGSPDQRHTLSATPQDLADIQVSHERHTRFGRFHAGLGYNKLKDKVSSIETSDVTAFIQWRSQ